jgi:signal peptide peptidase SppA
VRSRWQAGHDAEAADFVNLRARPGGPASRQAGAVVGGIQVLPLHGLISQRGDLLEAIFGGGSASTDAFSRALRGALADDAVGGVLIDVDSPGGSVYGVGELAAEIYAARAVRPVFAVANSLAGSAAYWIASSASQMFASPGAEVGSVGCYALHTDLSVALEREGIKTTLISAGKFKTEGASTSPLGAEAKGAIQDRIDQYYGAFTRSVARGRGVSVDAVRNGMGQGRIVGAGKAVSENMIDGVATFDQVVAKLGAVLQQGKPPGARVALAGSKVSAQAEEQARLRQEARARDIELHG